MSTYKNSYFDVIILAGGESKRFGEDKCDHELDCKTFLQRIVDQFANPIIVTNKKRLTLNKGIQIIDNFRLGPLKGLELGLELVRAEKFFLTGCDFPFIKYDLAKYLCDKLDDFDIVLVDNGELQPLLACYKTLFVKEKIRYAKRLLDLVNLAKRVYIVGTFELKLNGFPLYILKNVNMWTDLEPKNEKITFSKLLINSP
ncbi:NTP transferase domain-containing protein [Sulfolobaceae archaeon RB850M]|jgi:molybdopterin-guanine dinucleotide biosynthesis protein A|nr:NTP transferase domain-containing protein [Sulfolobaceae archaeon]